MITPEIGKAYRVTFQRVLPGGSAAPAQSLIWTADTPNRVANLTRIAGLVGKGFVLMRTARNCDDEWSVLNMEEV